MQGSDDQAFCLQHWQQNRPPYAILLLCFHPELKQKVMRSSGHPLLQVSQCCSKGRCRQRSQQQGSLAATLNVCSTDSHHSAPLAATSSVVPAWLFLLITAYSWRTASHLNRSYWFRGASGLGHFCRCLVLHFSILLWRWSAFPQLLWTLSKA